MLNKKFWFLLIPLILSSNLLLAQKQKTSVELQGPSATALEVEAQIQRGLPDVLENLKASAESLKNNQWDESTLALQEAKKTMDAVMDNLRKIPQDQEREASLRKIDDAMNDASSALERKKKSQASNALNQAYRRTMALSQSPILKLTASKISLYLADQQIRSKNYSSAGDFLGRAIDSLVAIQEDPHVNQDEIRSLKNSIVVAHQQVINGQIQDKTYMEKLYQRAEAATQNALYHYYDIWTRTPVPWEQN